MAINVLRDDIEHEKTVVAQIERAMEAADRGEFASDDKVAAMRARRWSDSEGLSGLKKPSDSWETNQA